MHIHLPKCWGLAHRVSAYTRIHPEIYFPFLEKGWCLRSLRIRVSTQKYTSHFLRKAGIYAHCISAYPPRNILTISWETAGVLRSLRIRVSAYPALPGVQLRSIRVFCSYSTYGFFAWCGTGDCQRTNFFGAASHVRVFCKYFRTVLRRGHCYGKVIQLHNFLPGNLSLYANSQIFKLRMVNPNANELTVFDSYL